MCRTPTHRPLLALAPLLLPRVSHCVGPPHYSTPPLHPLLPSLFNREAAGPPLPHFFSSREPGHQGAPAPLPLLAPFVHSSTAGGAASHQILTEMPPPSSSLVSATTTRSPSELGHHRMSPLSPSSTGATLLSWNTATPTLPSRFQIAPPLRHMTIAISMSDECTAP
jgi:hypothetical protein